MYKARYVPVGADQVPHIELTREVARRFNNTWGPVFPEPDAKLTQIPKVPGTDGRKMSKSYDNAIYLSDSPEEITAKIKPMVTDPARKRRTDPGNPDICPVFDLHRIFTPDAPRETAATGCRTAGIGCLDCKAILLEHMLPPLAAIRERRERYAAKPAEPRRDPARGLAARAQGREGHDDRGSRRREPGPVTHHRAAACRG
jgi:tryptophanyl-tRNA synthetase